MILLENKLIRKTIKKLEYSAYYISMFDIFLIFNLFLIRVKPVRAKIFFSVVFFRFQIKLISIVKMA